MLVVENGGEGWVLVVCCGCWVERRSRRTGLVEPPPLKLRCGWARLVPRGADRGPATVVDVFTRCHSVALRAKTNDQTSKIGHLRDDETRTSLGMAMDMLT